MTEQELLGKMISPGMRRASKWREGVIQIHVTRACDKACFGCTQGSQLGGKITFMPPEMFRQACQSLKGYFGVVGMFGGNPAAHPQFGELCKVMREEVPAEQRGLWSNNPLTVDRARIMRETFNPGVSNLNVHLDQDAYQMFKAGWPESMPVGLVKDSVHSPCYVAMKDVVKVMCDRCGGDGKAHGSDRPFEYNPEVGYPGPCPVCNGSGQVYDEPKANELISNCDINQHWSAMIGMFRGQLRAWFCEIAGAQAMLHQDDPGYPDTGFNPILTAEDIDHYPHLEKVNDDLACPDCCGGGMDGRPIRNAGPCAGCGGKGWVQWWRLPMYAFANQVRKHCHECSVPLRGYGELAQADNPDIYRPRGWQPKEQVSDTHAAIFKTKRKGRRVELVTVAAQIQPQALGRMTDYIGNSTRR